MEMFMKSKSLPPVMKIDLEGLKPDIWKIRHPTEAQFHFKRIVQEAKAWKRETRFPGDLFAVIRERWDEALGRPIREPPPSHDFGSLTEHEIMGTPGIMVPPSGPEEIPVMINIPPMEDED
jgi:hypothetical protein